MVFKRNGMRAAVGAAAMAMVLVAGSPVQAKMYKFTMTGVKEDGSTITGSVNVDSDPRYTGNYNDLAFGNVSYGSYETRNATGYFAKVFSDFGYYNEFYFNLQEFIQSDSMGILATSDQARNGILSRSYAEFQSNFDASSLFTSAALSSGLFNDFQVGTYALGASKAINNTDSFDLNTSALLSRSFESVPFVSASLQIGPGAPAPLVGGGLLSALAALLGLGLTRLGRRRDVLA